MNVTKIIGAVALVLVGAAAYWQFAGPSTAQTATVETSSESEANVMPDNEFGITEMSIGNPDAAVTVIEYASFTCPHCARFHANQFKELKADYIDTGKINFIYRDVFFDRPGLWASLVARCGGRDRFFGISDMIYAEQSEWLAADDAVGISNNLRRIGKVAGLSDAELETCLTDAQNAENLYAWFQANAEADNIRSTPTLMINGEQYANMNYSELSDLIDAKLGE